MRHNSHHSGGERHGTHRQKAYGTDVCPELLPGCEVARRHEKRREEDEQNQFRIDDKGGNPWSQCERDAAEDQRCRRREVQTTRAELQDDDGHEKRDEELVFFERRHGSTFG